jgi:hypothetical protein
MNESADHFEARSQPFDGQCPLPSGNVDRNQSESFAMRTRAETMGICVLGFFGLWAFPCIAFTADAERATKRPNVLLMIADDMSWKDWGV